MTALIDLHMHSSFSDGTHTPTELMRLCKKKKVRTASITDHDTLAGQKEAALAAKEHAIEYIPGIEISVAFEPGAIHMLGYFVDVDSSALKQGLKSVQDSRKERNKKILAKLDQLGFSISEDDLLQHSEACRGADEKQLGRPHIARALIDKGYAESYQEVFKKYLGKGAQAYFEKWRLSAGEAIRMIKEAGGVAVLAHPMTLGLAHVELRDVVKKMASEGLDGIEAYHSAHKPRDRNNFEALASEFDLGLSGGSDFHGATRPGVDIGDLGRGSKFDQTAFEKLKSKREK